MNRWALILIVAGAMLLSISYVAYAAPPAGEERDIVFRPSATVSPKPGVRVTQGRFGTIRQTRDYKNKSTSNPTITLLVGNDWFLASSIAFSKGLYGDPDGPLMYVQVDPKKKTYCWNIDNKLDHSSGPKPEFFKTSLGNGLWTINDTESNLIITTKYICSGSD